MNINIIAFDSNNRTVTAYVLADDGITQLIPALTINGLDPSLCINKDLLIAYLSDMFRPTLDNITATANIGTLLDPSTVIGQTAVMTTDDAITARANAFAMMNSTAASVTIGGGVLKTDNETPVITVTSEETDNSSTVGS